MKGKLSEPYWMHLKKDRLLFCQTTSLQHLSISLPPSFPSLRFDASNQRRCCPIDQLYFSNHRHLLLPQHGSTRPPSAVCSPKQESSKSGQAGAATAGSTKLRRRLWASSARAGRSAGQALASSATTCSEVRAGRPRRARPVASGREQSGLAPSSTAGRVQTSSVPAGVRLRGPRRRRRRGA